VFDEVEQHLNKHARYTSEEVWEHVEDGMVDGRSCRCGEEDAYGPCLLHTIKDHYQRPGCCDQPERRHRHMTSQEYDHEFPQVFKRTFETGNERYLVDARRYWDGAGVCLTRLFGDSDDSGHCFDFSADAVAGLARALTELSRVLDARENERSRSEVSPSLP
jgi:hypothetical protein